MKKKYWIGSLLSALVIIGAVMMVQPSLALFTSQDSEINNFKTGDVKIGIVENNGDGFNCPPTGIETTCPKKVQIQNLTNLTTETDAVIRVAIVPYWQDGNNAWPGDVSESVVHLEFDERVSEHWLEIGDYYYYKSLVAPGEENMTEPLLKEVTITIPEDLKNRYLNKTLVVDVKAEAVQPSIAAIKAVWPELTDDQVQSIISGMAGIKQ